MKKIVFALLCVLCLAPAAFAKVNINTATADELASLPGITKARAEKIVKYRDENGFFSSLEDLKNIDMINDKLIESIRDELEL